MLIASALSHVTQLSSHKSRNPQKQTGHPLSYPSILLFPKYHLLLENIYHAPVLYQLQKSLPHPPVIAYKRNASLRDLLVHSELPENKPSDQQPAGLFINASTHVASLVHFSKKAKLLTLFSPLKKTRKITNYISCHSKNLIYLIQCKKCRCQYIGETKRQLNERVTPQNVIIAAKCNTDAKCNNNRRKM